MRYRDASGGLEAGGRRFVELGGLVRVIRGLLSIAAKKKEA
jgi:hypothetical protein